MKHQLTECKAGLPLKKINTIFHNRIKGKKLCDNSIVAENAFDKVQHPFPFMIRGVTKIGTESNIFTMAHVINMSSKFHW